MKEFAASLVLGEVNQIVSFLAPLLLTLFVAASLVIRRAPNFVQIAYVYSCLASLLVFSSVVEPYLAYYFVPVYALVFASVTDRRTLAVAVSAAILSAAIPEGPLQMVLPLASAFAITVLQDSSLRVRNQEIDQLALAQKTEKLVV